MIMGRYGIMRKAIAIVASIAIALYVSYAAVFAAAALTEINPCCYASAENRGNLYTASCCTDDCSDCCYSEVPPQNETFFFFGLLDRESYRNNMCDLQIRIPDRLIFAELSGIVSEERLTPKNIVYLLFRPPKV
jgi:hypothetical protein